MDAEPSLVDQIRAAVRADLAALIARAGRRWMTIKAGARHSSLSPVTIRRLLKAGKLTAHRPVRGRVLVDRQQLDNLIATSTTELRKGRGRRT